MLLNTGEIQQKKIRIFSYFFVDLDLHNEALQQRRMTVDEFVENLAELNDGTNFPDSLLRDVYSAIKVKLVNHAMMMVGINVIGCRLNQ